MPVDKLIGIEKGGIPIYNVEKFPESVKSGKFEWTLQVRMSDQEAEQLLNDVKRATIFADEMDVRTRT